MNDGAEQIFGYPKEELIGKKRVSIFSPGEIVLQNVEGWLDEAVKKGEYIGKTYFIKKNKEKFNAKIRITPTFANGKDKAQTGYCGVTEVIEENVDVPINFSTKLIKGLAITRMPFTSASILPILAVGAYFAGIDGDLFNITNFVLCIFGVLIAHLSVNVLNDYFDVKDGTDEANSDYFQQVSGGSRAIELGLISLSGTKKLGLIIRGKIKSIKLGNIQSKRDWGHAKDYVEGMWKILQHNKAEDFVLATGYKKNVIKNYFKSFKKLGEAFETKIKTNKKKCKIGKKIR